MTVDELRSQRDELRAAINSGALSIRHGDKQVMYQSTTAMIAALASLDAEIARAEGRKRKRRFAYPASKGL